MSKTKGQSLRLNARERDLVARYGYPFEDLEQQLQRSAGKTGTVTISIDPFYLDHLTADLAYSARKLTDEGILDELDELLAKIDYQLTLR